MAVACSVCCNKHLSQSKQRTGDKTVSSPDVTKETAKCWKFGGPLVVFAMSRTRRC